MRAHWAVLEIELTNTHSKLSQTFKKISANYTRRAPCIWATDDLLYGRRIKLTKSLLIEGTLRVGGSNAALSAAIRVGVFNGMCNIALSKPRSKPGGIVNYIARHARRGFTGTTGFKPYLELGLMVPLMTCILTRKA